MRVMLKVPKRVRRLLSLFERPPQNLTARGEWSKKLLEKGHEQVREGSADTRVARNLMIEFFHG
jgi:hypothetical protein